MVNVVVTLSKRHLIGHSGPCFRHLRLFSGVITTNSVTGFVKLSQIWQF